MKSEKREVRSEKRGDMKVALDFKGRKIILAFFSFLFSLLICTCATTGGAGNASRAGKGKDLLVIRGGKTMNVDLDKTVEAVFATFDPIFQKNLKPRAAVAIFPISTEDMRDSDIIGERLSDQLSVNYELIEKRKVDELLDEYDFQKSGEVGVLTIGELLEADAVIFGSITRLEGELHLVFIAVDVAKRQTLAVASEKL